MTRLADDMTSGRAVYMLYVLVFTTNW